MARNVSVSVGRILFYSVMGWLVTTILIKLFYALIFSWYICYSSTFIKFNIKFIDGYVTSRSYEENYNRRNQVSFKLKELTNGILWMTNAFFWWYAGNVGIVNCVKKFPYSELFWPLFSHIQTEYGDTEYLSVASLHIQSE